MHHASSQNEEKALCYVKNILSSCICGQVGSLAQIYSHHMMSNKLTRDLQESISGDLSFPEILNPLVCRTESSTRAVCVAVQTRRCGNAVEQN